MAASVALAPPLGLVLVGGASRRMGGLVKAMLPFGRRPMAAWSAAALAPHCRSVALATGSLGDLPGLALLGLPDRFPGLGPVAGLHAGLLEAGEAGILVLPCDLPLLEPAHLAPLLEGRAGHDVVIYAHERGLEPLVGWYGPRCLEPLECLLRGGGGRIRAIYPRLRVATLPWAFHPDLLMNLNRPEELRAAERAVAPLGAPPGEASP